MVRWVDSSEAEKADPWASEEIFEFVEIGWRHCREVEERDEQVGVAHFNREVVNRPKVHVVEE